MNGRIPAGLLHPDKLRVRTRNENLVPEAEVSENRDGWPNIAVVRDACKGWLGTRD